MNKERDLLKEIMIYFAKGDITIRKFENSGDIAETFHSVQELLAQPEQESVYQKLSRIEDGIEVEILPSELWQDGYETGKRTMQPEQEPVAIDENTSDGYHTFKELYEFRKAYNVALFNEWGATGKCHTHKSWRHNDGELCFGGGWFIVVAVLPQGQISNHYEAKDWDLFSIQEVEKALFEFDGHTGADVVERLKLYTALPKRGPLSDEEVMRLGVLNCCNEANAFKPFGFARAIEKAHGIGGGE